MQSFRHTRVYMNSWLLLLFILCDITIDDNTHINQHQLCHTVEMQYEERFFKTIKDLIVETKKGVIKLRTYAIMKRQNKK